MNVRVLDFDNRCLSIDSLELNWRSLSSDMLHRQRSCAQMHLEKALNGCHFENALFVLSFLLFVFVIYSIVLRSARLIKERLKVTVIVRTVTIEMPDRCLDAFP